MAGVTRTCGLHDGDVLVIDGHCLVVAALPFGQINAINEVSDNVEAVDRGSDVLGEIIVTTLCLRASSDKFV